MTRKDYEFIAEILRYLPDRESAYQFAQVFCSHEKLKNPRFDPARFCLAAGVQL